MFDIAFLAIMVLVLYLFIIRPASAQRKRFAQVRAMQEALVPGTKVMTTSGIHGTVRVLDDETVGLEVAPGTVVTIARAAIAEVVGDAAQDPQA